VAAAVQVPVQAHMLMCLCVEAMLLSLELPGASCLITVSVGSTLLPPSI